MYADALTLHLIDACAPDSFYIQSVVSYVRFRFRGSALSAREFVVIGCLVPGTANVLSECKSYLWIHVPCLIATAIRMF